jgi:hypothetical protein
MIAAAALLGGCDSAVSGTAVSGTTVSGTTSPRLTPPPTAADGTNISACSDAVCEVSVGPGTAIPLPASTGVKNVKVTTVTRDRVTLTGEDAGNSSSGSCTGQCDSNDSNGVFTVTLGPDSEDEENGVAVAVEGFSDGRVVLKFDVAP